MKKNKKEIPLHFTKAVQPGTARFAYHKAGYILYEKNISEIVDFYNKTKNSMDTFDQLVHYYSVARITNRWPMRIFYGMIDQGGVNANILYSLSPSATQKIVRRELLKDLGFGLVKPLMLGRLNRNVTQSSIKRRIREILHLDVEYRSNETEVTIKTSKPLKCTVCYDKTTIWVCSSRKKGDCDQHVFILVLSACNCTFSLLLYY